MTLSIESNAKSIDVVKICGTDERKIYQEYKYMHISSNTIMKDYKNHLIRPITGVLASIVLDFASCNLAHDLS